MINRHLCIVFALGLSGCVTSNDVPLAKIPPQFQGQWVTELATCNIEGFGNDGDMYVSADAVSFHAEPYAVKTVKQRGKTIYVTYTPPAEQYMVPPPTLRLSQNGKVLNKFWHQCLVPPGKIES